MHFLDLTLPSLAENLALDEALLLAAESGEAARHSESGEWPTIAVVLGFAGRIAEDVDEAACVADRVPILRRSSGGGTVLLGSGCLLYSLILSYERDPCWRKFPPASYPRSDQGGAAEDIGHIEQAGVSDLALDGRKFSGSAQQRKRLLPPASRHPALFVRSAADPALSSANRRAGRTIAEGAIISPSFAICR